MTDSIRHKPKLEQKIKTSMRELIEIKNFKELIRLMVVKQ
jgi:hypothetical protein